ncbi:MAG TPA: TRAP transporter small permease subunit [Candidatus Tenderia electrophaga]|uniref:TRAP transporter small permease protein n=1 Tax=Candidatus Tenderia electrophaga TaxID=1748243 RepID=A0A832J3C4_9GAMM|nr:TRAP transporter small permease subunit [Candidatus Tenderia electrophaga]
MNVLLQQLDKLANAIDQLSEWFGRLTAWLVVALVLLVCYDVSMRYLFQAGSVALQELEWHIFALIFLLGAAYTLKHDEHVRVDVFYQSKRMTPRRQAMVNLFGCLFMLLPFCVLMIVSAAPFVEMSFGWAESSPDPGGLPYRWLLKAMIPAGFVLLFLQGLALSIHSLLAIVRADTSAPEAQ